MAPLTACCTPARLLEGLAMPQGSVKVNNLIVDDLSGVPAYVGRRCGVRLSSSRVRKPNLILSPLKGRLNAVDVDILGYSIFPGRVSSPQREQVVRVNQHTHDAASLAAFRASGLNRGYHDTEVCL